MDTATRFYSTTEVAKWLGTSVPSIHRAISRLELKPDRGAKGHLQLTEQDAHLLREHLGKAPRIDGFTREELFVLRVLLTRPLGLRSGRVVARHAGISPSTALKVLNNLERRGMVEYRHLVVAEGSVKEIEVWILRVIPHWITDKMALDIRGTIPPVSVRPMRMENRVPRRFKHLFWNVDLAELDTKDYGPAIAVNILEQDDPHALAWAIHNLDPEAFATAALPRRGFTPEMSALAAHIARSKEAECLIL